jgi:hypothetical protein
MSGSVDAARRFVVEPEVHRPALRETRRLQVSERVCQLASTRSLFNVRKYPDDYRIELIDRSGK